MQNASDSCDVAIIGAGPVGLFAVFECGMLDMGCHLFDALPAPGKHAPHVVFGNNLMATFNVVEACVRWAVPRLVNISSETVPGGTPAST